MWGLSRADQLEEASWTEWVEAEEANHLECPFHEWSAINNHDDSVQTAVDMLLKFNGKMRFFPTKDAVVITFYDPVTGIEGSCFATGTYVDSDDADDSDD